MFNANVENVRKVTGINMDLSVDEAKLLYILFGNLSESGLEEALKSCGCKGTIAKVFDIDKTESCYKFAAAAIYDRLFKYFSDLDDLLKEEGIIPND